MNQKILDHYLKFSQFTYPGLYEAYLKEKLPNDIKELCVLLRKQLIHRSSLENHMTGIDASDKEIKSLPWWKQDEDDNFNTAAAIIAELFRRDKRGIVSTRKAKDKLIVTCRHTTLLVAAALKAKGIPCRVRSGNAPYFPFEKLSSDHWINQYWDKKDNRWVSIDVDGSGHNTGYDMFDLPKDAFDFPAKAWLDSRSGKDNPERFFNARPATGLKVVGWSLFYDFHCLMNNEIIYIHNPKYLYGKWDKNAVTEKEMKDIDTLAELMLDPDKNFEKLVEIWNTNKNFRILKGGLL